MRRVAILCLVLAAGCVSRPYPEKELYALDSGRPRVHERGHEILRVAPVRVASPFDGGSFVYRTGELRYDPDYYRGFVAAPGKLLTGEAIRYLDEGGSFASVVDAGASVTTPLTLEATVLELGGDYRDREHPVAAVRARFLLVVEEDDSTRLLGHWVLEARVRLLDGDAPALARGLGLAWGEVLARLAERLERHGPT